MYNSIVLNPSAKIYHKFTSNCNFSIDNIHKNVVAFTGAKTDCFSRVEHLVFCIVVWPVASRFCCKITSQHGLDECYYFFLFCLRVLFLFFEKKNVREAFKLNWTTIFARNQWNKTQIVQVTRQRSMWLCVCARSYETRPTRLAVWCKLFHSVFEMLLGCVLVAYENVCVCMCLLALSVCARSVATRFSICATSLRM